MIDLLFPVIGDTLPTDHAYALYGALSRVVPAFHDAAAGVRFCPVSGEPVPGGRLQLNDRSVLRVRLLAEQAALAMPLAGQRLEVDGHSVRLGAPRAAAIVPAATLIARVVTLKNHHQGHGSDLLGHALNFAAKLSEMLAAAGLSGEVSVPLFPAGARAGQPQRRVVRVKGRRVVGYACVVSGLSAADSVRLQAQGLGGRTRMGCGFFLPKREG
jgi:CRISPR-associated protein Cas6